MFCGMWNGACKMTRRQNWVLEYFYLHNWVIVWENVGISSNTMVRIWVMEHTILIGRVKSDETPSISMIFQQVSPCSMKTWWKKPMEHAGK